MIKEQMFHLNVYQSVFLYRICFKWHGDKRLEWCMRKQHFVAFGKYSKYIDITITRGIIYVHVVLWNVCLGFFVSAQI